MLACQTLALFLYIQDAGNFVHSMLMASGASRFLMQSSHYATNAHMAIFHGFKLVVKTIHEARG